jgi:hypothetical protein
MARKSRAKYYLGEPLRGRPVYHTMRWYDKKMRLIQSSVEVLINTEFISEECVYYFQRGL